MEPKKNVQELPDSLQGLRNSDNGSLETLEEYWRHTEISEPWINVFRVRPPVCVPSSVCEPAQHKPLPVSHQPVDETGSSQNFNLGSRLSVELHLLVPLDLKEHRDEPKREALLLLKHFDVEKTVTSLLL